ncbi:ABC transporter ATP-binding protein [Caproiciproducens sp. MSJ-32]|uniref:ABC transporter ATP-binding protein n=1 Tax=Caproiciproducens sp. MSJ-32 TaxID=2841527 RepID=UPI001C121305|nr:ABC transporter ATP-binding protein [Caproiciproducens sp. MSJ-32]MBU5454984.1 ABC transporter ATP-binding protein [Caproiciproducens sp. MSJ-32]
MLEVVNYSFKYGENLVLEDISFSLGKGKILGIIGPSGCGKTSLVKAIVGIYESKESSIRLFGRQVYDNAEVKRNIAYVPDEQPSFYLITIKEIVNFYKSIYSSFSEERFYKINKVFKIPLNKRFMQLSKGMKMRVSIMIAFSLDASLLVLDEPTSGLDPILKKAVLNLVREEVSSGEKSAIITSHNLRDLEEVCDEILIINNGKVDYYNTLNNMKENIKKIQVAFDKPIYEEDLACQGIITIDNVGRVFTIITEKYDDKFIKSLQQYEPLFIEEIDLNLEEIFIYKLGKEKEYEKIFK